MFNKKSTLIAVSLLCLGSYTLADNTHCAIETRINCNSHCDVNTIKCPDNDNFLYNKTFLTIRPQDSNAARRIQVGQTRAELFYEGFCTKINLALEYQQTFNNSKLAKWFSLNCSDCMSIGIPGNGLTFDIDGRQLGLATTGLVPGSIGSFCFSPKMQNFIADLDVQVNLDNVLCGLWARMDLPIVWAKTNIGLRTTTANLATSGTFPAGQFSTDCSTTPIAESSIAAALLGDVGFGDVPSLMCGRIASKGFSKFDVAGIHFDLGYDFIRNDCGNLGLSLHIVTPTGTKVRSRYLFEPIVGANRCFQLGANVNASYNMRCHDISFMLDATLTHLFKSHQRRIVGLKNNGAGSQFLLLKRFNAIGTALVGVEQASDVLCARMNIGADYMFDGAVMAQFNVFCDFFINIGYNLWLRSKEKRGNTVYLNNFGENSLGIKGNQPLSVTRVSPCPTLQCVSTCIPDLSTASGSTVGVPAAADATTTFISLSDIDFCLPLNPFALTNKFFASIGYNGCFCDHPYEILVGGEVEFGRRNNTLDQWGILVKGGIAF